MKEISWKQFFAVICINLCKEKPTVKELAEIMGSSHQNVKQILLKLEKKGFVHITVDEKDKRKQRIELTDYCREFCAKNDEMTTMAIGKMFEGVSPEQLQVTIVDKTVFRHRLSDTLKKSEWILDGNYGSTLELRLKECDTVIFLDYPLELCLEGIKERRGKERTDMPWVEAEGEEVWRQQEYLHAVVTKQNDLYGQLNKESNLQVI